MERTPSRLARISAAAVHAYTASGAVLAFLVVAAALRGDVVQALWFGLIAMFIDSTDGMLARRFRVSEMLPWFDGGRLDDIVDYLTYVFAPILLLWNNNYLPSGTTGMILAILPLLASSYQFCRVDAKTDDHFFLGFPSYWNVVAFYAVTTQMSPLAVGTMLVVFSALVFVPIRYVYPSRTVMFRPITLAVSGIWMITYAAILLQMPVPSVLLIDVSVLCTVYYFGLSLFFTFQRRNLHEPRAA